MAFSGVSPSLVSATPVSPTPPPVVLGSELVSKGLLTQLLPLSFRYLL